MRQRKLVRVRWGGILLVLLGVLAAVALVVAATPMGRYIARGAVAEAKILGRRQSIAKMVADSSTPPAVRAKLQLVLEARKFAVDSLGLPAKDAFTQYTKLEHDTLVLVLSGAYRDEIRSVTWWFPIVGSVPYKGYFDFAEAKRAEVELRDKGFDTYLRPSPAFSTLGFFNDPLLSTTLGEDSLDIVNTVVHELTHNKFYAKGGAVFNESFANFVGARGAERFFFSRGDTAGARRAAARWQDELLLAGVWERTYHSLDSAYRALPGDSSRTARYTARDTIYARTRRLLVDSIGPQLKTIDPRYAALVRLDNASLFARLIYATGLPKFETVYESEGRDIRRALERIIREKTAAH
ncbi:MAG TPA: aminopeptidase [Gemmatimonadaceae bacterium]|nr:aminopeptidase [Gemmatimonadaceae bacterium]